MFTNLQREPLTEQQIFQKAPSVFAEGAHYRVSQQYQFISTQTMIDGLAQEGWLPVHAEESRVRLPDRKGFSKHLLRFRRFDNLLPLVGDSYPEIVLVNSHDGSCAYQIHAGLFRLVCSNGMIIADADMGQVRRRHTGEAVREIIEGTYEIVDNLPRIADRVDTFQEITLNPEEQEAFAQAALGLRWDQDRAPVTAHQLTKPRRFEDTKDNLWISYQRIQENLLKGGIRGTATTGRRISTRAVKSVDGNVKLNQALWLLTERMAELKKA